MPKRLGNWLSIIPPRQFGMTLLAVVVSSIFLCIAFLFTCAWSREPYSMPPLVRVGFIGDSILQGNNLAAKADLITSLTDRELTWAHALYPNFSIDTWIDMAEPTRHFDGLNAGFSGETTAQVLARAAAPLRFSPRIMIVSAGINSVINGVSAASIESDLQSICERYLDRGITVILSNIRPVETSIIPDASPKLIVREEVNAWIKDFSSSTTGIEFWDAASAYDNGRGRPIAGYTADGIHPVSLGSQQAAFNLLPILRRLIDPVAQPLIPDEYNFFPNGRLNGTNGIVGAATAGIVASGFKAGMISHAATVTVKASILKNANTGVQVQEFRFSAHRGSNFEIFSFTPEPPGFYVLALAGKWVKARCKLKLSAWNGWRSINFNVSYMNWGSLNPNFDQMTDNKIWELNIETMPFKLPYFPSRITPLLWIFVDGKSATGEGLAQIEQLEFFQVVDPRLEVK